MAKGKYEADNFIEQLLAEKRELQTELAARARLEELLDQLDTTGVNNPGANNQPPANGATAGIDETQLETILNRREKERAGLNNINQVKTKLKEIFGNDYATRLQKFAQENDMTSKEVDALAASKPNMLLRLIAPQRQGEQGVYTPPSSQLNSGFGTGQPKTRTYAWYQQLKKTNPKEYWSAKTQMQLHKDAIEAARLGQEF